MLDKIQRDEILALMKREIVPAIGCTEPVAVALCVARATELLGCCPEKIEVLLSSNVLKNAMGVGIPGTGMIGLPIAIALGALVGKSEYALEVLRDVNADAVERGKQFIAQGRIKVSLDNDAPCNLHITVKVEDGHGNNAIAIISREHTKFVYLQKGANVILQDEKQQKNIQNCSCAPKDIELNMSMVWDFATESPIEELNFILEARNLNKAAAQKAFEHDAYGHSLGYTIRNHGAALFGDTPIEHIMAYTSAACDARMAGAMIPVMSNSGSGNQGITATMPVVSYAEDINATEEQLIRALTLSHLTSIYIKQSLGRLSALCGCVVASTGAASGIVYLMGGGYVQVCAAIKNMVANLTGMVCDGAKPSCAMKVTSSVSTAMLSAMLAMHGKCVTENEGIISNDVDATIHNLTSLGRNAMTETDRLVLKIMTNK